MNSIKLILFDFDGTIADSHDASVETYNALSGKYRIRKVESEDIKVIREKSTLDGMKYLGISLMKLPFLMRDARVRFQSRIDSLKPIDGIHPSLIQLKENGFQLGILTSNSEVNVRAFLSKNNLELFDLIYSGASVFGKAKMIKGLLKKHKLKEDQAIYVGDETRDIEAAKAAGIRVISVAWGFNTHQILSTHKPDFLIQHPSELIQILSSMKCDIAATD